MRKMIAQRPIQYLGRAYERGAVLPANDSLMTAAWLKAGSAAWEDSPAEKAAPSPDKPDRREAERQAVELLESYGVAIVDGNGAFVGKEALEKQLISVPLAETQTASTLRALGVELTDGAGRFVGEERLKEQVYSLAQEPLKDREAAVPAAEECPAEKEGGVLAVGPDGHYSRADLARLSKAELLDLAHDLGVDLDGCRTNAERAATLAAVDAGAILDAAPTGTPA